jgi:hypothetical protein
MALLGWLLQGCYIYDSSSWVPSLALVASQTNPSFSASLFPTQALPITSAAGGDAEPL